MTELDFSVFDLISPLVVLLERDGRVARWNRACSERTGYPLEDVRGKFLWDMLLPDEQVEDVKRVVTSLRDGHFPSRSVHDWVTAKGQRRRIVWSNNVLLGPKGEVAFLICTGIDVTMTERPPKETRGVDNAPRSLRSPYPMWIVDRGTLQLLAVNDAAVERYGHSREELLRKKLTEVCAMDEPAALADMLTELRPDVMWTGPCHHKRADGTSVECEMGVLPMDFGGRPAAMVLVRERS